jgi:hypothetical protein
MKKKYFGSGLLILLLVSVGVLGFISSRKADTAKSAKFQLIDPEDMVQGEIYFFADHGNGMSVVEFDRLDKGTGTIYSTFSITPLQSLFSRNAPGTVYAAGDIRLATSGEIAHLQQCIIADRYIP